MFGERLGGLNNYTYCYPNSNSYTITNMFTIIRGTAEIKNNNFENI